MASFVRYVLVLLLIGVQPLFAQRDVDVAIRFFSAGGAYCFRLAPEGVALNDETEWTVMVLAGTRNTQKAFRIRTVDPGASGAKGADLRDISLVVAGVWRMDRSRADFVERFSAAMAEGRVVARVVKITPPRLADMAARERAEEYLKFSDRGTKVSFSKSPELTPAEFARFSSYLAD